MEIFVLDCFRERRAMRLTLSEIVGESTANRHETLIDAIWTLESQHRMLRRSGTKDSFELTELGKQYVRELRA